MISIFEAVEEANKVDKFNEQQAAAESLRLAQESERREREESAAVIGVIVHDFGLMIPPEVKISVTEWSDMSGRFNIALNFPAGGTVSFSTSPCVGYENLTAIANNGERISGGWYSWTRDEFVHCCQWAMK